jgi:streptogramin lyase
MKMRAHQSRFAAAFVAAAVVFGLLCTACGAPPSPTSSSASSLRGESVTGVPGGFRATAFDASRNCLWIVTRYFKQAGVALVDLTRFDINSGTASSPLRGLSGSGFIQGSVAVDSAGIVWMGWGRTLTRFDPSNNVTHSWPLPETTGAKVTPEHAGLDGNAVAIAISSSDIWVALNSVQAVFDFNVGLSTWDKTIDLSFAPNLMTRLTVSPSGILAINGIDARSTPMMALISTSTGATLLSQAGVTDYVLLDDDTLAYLDVSNGLIRRTISTGVSVPAATGMPASGRPELAVDGFGNIWFSMTAYKSVGVGKVSPSTGEISTYPFPQAASQPTGALMCPGPAFQCDAALVFDPEVQSIVVDASNNLWVTTAVPGVNGDPNFTAPAAALYELPAGS